MMLNCMISAFCLAVMHMQVRRGLRGVCHLQQCVMSWGHGSTLMVHISAMGIFQGSRSSEEQLISTGICLTVASFAFSFATPIEKLSHVR